MSAVEFETRKTTYRILFNVCFLDCHPQKLILMHFVIIPGNGCGDVSRANWYGWAQKKIAAIDNVTCDLRNMPDPMTARESVWISFMRNEMKCGDDSVIIGHSSGAEAAMRFAERYKVRGIIVVSACVTDLGMDSERESGYYSRPWDWESIKANAQWRVQFGSTDDPFIAWSEQQQVADGMEPALMKFDDRGHFMDTTFPELVTLVKKRIAQPAL